MFGTLILGYLAILLSFNIATVSEYYNEVFNYKAEMHPVLRSLLAIVAMYCCCTDIFSSASPFLLLSYILLGINISFQAFYSSLKSDLENQTKVGLSNELCVTAFRR